jgi:rSAM/selenodomain-associated transferase 1
MAKASVAGRAKTRLIPTLGAEAAAALNTAFLQDVAANLDAAAQLASIDPWMAYAPAGSEAFFRAELPAHVGLLETIGPDLGACLFLAVERLFARGYGTIALLNSDSPTLPTACLVAAATALAADGDRMVIGPAVDGGYYLIGLKTAHRRLFEDIAWSTEHVFEQTLARARDIDLPVVVLPSWYDVDEPPMLRLLARELLDGLPFRSVVPRLPECARTRTLFATWLADPMLARALGPRLGTTWAA